ncbi:6-bladed beta-propeller [Rhodohalobacter mucosus]|uniref:6-bladed beta-propeller protein n=1 Tax=Rhodohalobacter mucosus TaxID=2079485 RepID=A0A316TL56_9BACT|nr:6-bladed beta-propeller [Rhodohalobacter mucosus]PWN05100.1 hypothetical protein DDZ15_16225 [Rhodohalobacter mucosus]
MMRIFVCNIVFAALILVSCDSDNHNTENRKSNIQLVYSFGHDSPGLLSNPYKLASDYDKFIYVSDPYKSIVIQYDMEGNFIREFGSRGRGPGELTHASVISADTGIVVVEDQGNKRTQIFDSNGELQSIFQHLHSSISMAVHDGKMYSFSPSSLSMSSNLVQDSLFVVTDFEGNEVRQFGEMKYKNSGLPSGAHWPAMKISGQKLYVAYIYFPVLEIYDLSGNKEFEVNLNDFEGLYNYDEDILSTIPAESMNQQMEAVIRAIDVIDENIYIMRQNKDVMIDKFSFNGGSLSHEETFIYTSKSEEYFPIDMIADPAGDGFYVLELGGQPKVSRYSVIRN